jgi:DNA-binding protein WhiA
MGPIAAELWDEWSSLPQGDEEADSAEAAGLLAALPFKINGEKDLATLGSSRLWALRRLLKLWKNSRWKGALNLAAYMRVPQDMKGRVELALPRELYEEAAATERESWDWVRGLWGGCGALYSPKSGYYLVMRTGAETALNRVKRMLQKSRVSWRERPVHGKREIILRDQEGIVFFLSKIGLANVSLRLEDKAILRTMRDQANRMRNCDTANIKKTLSASEEQRDLALKLLNKGLLETLPLPLKALVEARLEYPEESLSDLGGRLSPPVTKSTVKYRWKRLNELAERE